MAPMVQLPPSVQNVTDESATTALLGDTIHSLCDLIFQIALANTDRAKNVTIAIANFWHACNLILSACTSMQAHHSNMQLNDIAKKLDMITACLAVPNGAQLSQPCSYASILAKPPVRPKASPGLQFNLTLVQANYTHPVLLTSKDDLSEKKIDKALMDMCCFFETKSCAPGLNGSDGVEHNTPHIHAIG